MSSGALARMIREAGQRRTEAAEERLEHCDLCSEPLPDEHRHLLDTGGDGGTSGDGDASGPPELLCACRACSLLFDRDAASAGHYRLVPRRRLRLAAVSTAALGVPVGLAFFVPRTDGSVHAHYPSPAGATGWEVDPQAWREAVRLRPELADMAPEVEALLVDTARGDRQDRQHWIVPVDDCYRLVALVRREWRGLSGGSRVWPAIERFFGQLTEQR